MKRQLHDRARVRVGVTAFCFKYDPTRPLKRSRWQYYVDQVGYKKLLGGLLKFHSVYSEEDSRVLPL